MKSNTFILLPILLVVLFGCGGGTLPDEAISAIEKVPVAYGNSQTWMGKIVSAQQTNIRTPNGESWCVVIDPPLLEYPTETSTIIVKREGLLWQVQTYSIGSLPVYGQSEESFLRNGCSNWQETISPSQPDITATPITQKPSQSTNFISTIARNVDWTPVERNFNNLTFVLAPSGCFTMWPTPAKIE